ncbi:MAG TPA: hypothetical protein VJN43_01735 [Bryobacteraceae bacterium]|nr:hypothetical protein [Bryobacteraceae bacterium]
MTVTALGRVNVATPGTPVPLSTDPTARASKIYFQVIPGLTGKGYIGAKGMVRATLVNVVRVLWPNSAGGFSDSFFLESQQDADVLNLSQYYIDMDVAGEGLLVSYWTE